MAITYDAPSNTITVTGYTEGAPCTFLDVWNADQAGGWGVVTKQGATQYLFDAFLQIGDGTIETWVIDERKEVELAAITTHWDTLILVKNNATLRLGEVIDAVKKITKDGCSIFETGVERYGYLIHTQTGGETELYSSSFIYAYDYYRQYFKTDAGGSLKIYNSLVQGVIVSEGTVDIYDTTFRNGKQLGTLRAISTPTLNKIFLFYNAYAIECTTIYSITIRNVLARSNSYAIRAYQPTVDSYIINGDIDTWNILWAAPATGKIYRQYSFNRKILDKNGKVYHDKAWTLKRSDGTTINSGTTQSDGKLSATDLTISHGYFDIDNGDTEQTYGPFKLEVEGDSKNAKLTLMNLPIDEKDVTGVETMPVPMTRNLIYSGPRRRLPPLPLLDKKMTTTELYELFLFFKTFMVVNEQIWAT